MASCCSRKRRRPGRKRKRPRRKRRGRRGGRKLVFGGGKPAANAAPIVAPEASRSDGESAVASESGVDSSGTGGGPPAALLKRIRKFKKQVPLLQVLKDITPEQRTIVLGSLDARACNSVVGCVRSVMKSKKLNKKTKDKLRKALSSQKDTLRKLIGEAKSSRKRELLPSVGGGLGVLLGTAIPILLEVARSKKWI